MESEKRRIDATLERVDSKGREGARLSLATLRADKAVMKQELQGERKKGERLGDSLKAVRFELEELQTKV